MPRRIGVTLLSLIFVVGGAACLFLSVASVPAAFGTVWEYDCGVGFTVVFVLGILGVFGILTGVGMLGLRRWAYWMGLLAAAVLVASGLLSATGGVLTVDPITRIVSLALAAASLPVGSALLWSMMRRSVREQFR